MNPSSKAQPKFFPSLATPAGTALAYVAFAVGWVLLSEQALNFTVEDPTLRNRLEVVKGLMFVLFTGGLLYMMLERFWSWRDADEQRPRDISGRRRLDVAIALVFVALVLLVPLLGYVIAQQHAPKTKADAYNELRAVVDLKANQMENWLAERRRDGRTLAENRHFMEQMAALAQWEGDTVPPGMQQRLDAFREAYKYQQVIIFHADGEQVVAVGEDAAAGAAQELLAQAAASGQVQVGSIFSPTGEIQPLDLVVPVMIGERRSRQLRGLMLLRVSSERFLQSQIHRWPTTRESGEIYLVNRENFNAVSLTRFGSQVQAPLIASELQAGRLSPAEAGAALEKTAQGTDYRGREVLAAYRPVAGSDWVMVAKLNQDEVMASLTDLVFWVSLVALFAVAVIGAALLMVFRQQQRLQDLLIQSERSKVDRLFRKFFELPFIGMAVNVPRSGEWVQFNDYLCEILGYDREEFERLGWQDITHPEDLHQDFERFEKVLTGELEGLRVDKRFLRKDGSIAYVALEIQCVRDDDGQPEYVFTAVQDITERIEMVNELRQSEALLRTLLQTVPDMIWLKDPRGVYLLCNRTFQQFAGFAEQDIVGKTDAQLVGAATAERNRAMDERVVETGEPLVSEDWVEFAADGRRVLMETVATPMYDNERQLIGVLAVARDITERRLAEENIERLAYFDSLTGLPNRSLLSDRVDNAMRQAKRDSSCLALLFLDLDHFKKVNDTLGHRVGDELLKQVALRLQSTLRESDTVSRQGGDEFVVVLPDTDANGAAHVAEKLLRVIAEPYRVEGQSLTVTPSIGIAVYPNDSQDVDMLYRSADIAMYRAKRDGRNAYRFFTPEMQADSARTLRLENDLRLAIAGNQLSLHYQPQIGLADGRLVGAEALVRWQHPKLGFISPGEFIPLAEDSGMIVQIGEWVLREAARQLRAWLDQGISLRRMAVNLSAVQFRDVHLPELVTRVLNESGVEPNCIELELTESVAMNDPLAAIDIMNKLDERGVQMSIDDFGTGYSSLNYLKRFKVYKLKIDQSFVREINKDQDSNAIIRAIINLAETLGMTTIAEGVETAEQLQFLRALNCDEMQGYYVSKPLPAADFEAFCRTEQNYLRMVQ